MSKTKEVFENVLFGRDNPTLGRDAREGAKHIAALRPGTQVLTHKVGDLVTGTGKGQIKQGVVFKVELAEIHFGYAKYYGAGCWHREQDITAV